MLRAFFSRVDYAADERGLAYDASMVLHLKREGMIKIREHEAEVVIEVISCLVNYCNLEAQLNQETELIL
jgi:hypothetical protein